MLKTASFEDDAAGTVTSDQAIDLAGKLYELAISQSDEPRKIEIIRELTFFYLSVSDHINFLKWSSTLLDQVEQDPSEHRAILFALGSAQILMDAPEQSVITFRRLLRDHKDVPEGFFGLSLTYLKLKDQDNLEIVLKQTRQIAPELAEIIDRLALKEDFSADDYAEEIQNLVENSR